MERRAINRTYLTFVHGDTVQRFTTTDARPTPRPGRFYYWQGPTQILRTAGAYNGRLLTGAYQLTSRNGNLLGSGTFRKGVKTGRWRTWRPDGTPISSSTWQWGQQRGKTQYYDATGQRLKPTPLPSEVAADTPPLAPPHFWQAAYWRDVLKRRQRRRQEKQRAKAAAPTPAKPPVKKTEDKVTVPASPAPTISPRPGS